MRQTGPRYTGHVSLGSFYRAPDGTVVTALGFTMQGIKVRRPDGQLATVRRADFARYLVQKGGTA